MSHGNEKGQGSTLGLYLQSLRAGKGMTLRQVEEATEKEVSNAYLSQLEGGKIKSPSPHILYALSEVYGVPYEQLMRRAGYIAPTASRGDTEKHGLAATNSIDHLTKEEEAALLEYLSFFRQKRGKS
ncbi:helix-turn-helix domain-containing protein [Tepidicaulis sp. LMO-SS28]|uniref:helix-turn-helix domain-containing protein n=1 Tax=Tepidicaulis sp. LMO-SS28 TaxID=3447455 RepID=UPI003EE0281D